MDHSQTIIDIFHHNVDCVMQASGTLAAPLSQASGILAQAILSEKKLICCGSGPAAALSQLASSNLLNRFQHERPGLPAISLSADSASLTGIATDNSLAEIYAQQIRALGQSGDVLLLLASDNDVSLLRTIQAAHERELNIILIGSSDDAASLLQAGDVEIRTPVNDRARQSELQLLCINTLCDLTDRQLFGT